MHLACTYGLEHGPRSAHQAAGGARGETRLVRACECLRVDPTGALDGIQQLGGDGVASLSQSLLRVGEQILEELGFGKHSAGELFEDVLVHVAPSLARL